MKTMKQLYFTSRLILALCLILLVRNHKKIVFTMISMITYYILNEISLYFDLILFLDIIIECIYSIFQKIPFIIHLIILFFIYTDSEEGMKNKTKFLLLRLNDNYRKSNSNQHTITISKNSKSNSKGQSSKDNSGN